MSRVGKLPVVIPQGLEVLQQDGKIIVKSGNQSMSVAASPLVVVKQENHSLSFECANDGAQANAMSGTLRQLVNNMIYGLSKNFEKRLTLVGVGYKAAVSANKLNLAVRFLDPVEIQMPEGVSAEVPTPTEIVIKGVDRQKVGQVAAEIRAIRPPEPYKGKGIRYANERIVIKETKKK